ncbi:MAG: hypothetical protein KAS17_10715, partial [Victivallaceae bacterium]|nr:hypothetical protein [Victivallaceae bacterium]
LYQMALASDGYWLFTLRSLRGKNSKKGDYVLYKGSTRKQYWDAFRSANTAIEGYKKKGASYCPPFRLK